MSGVIRGAPLSADRLIHIPNAGDFQVQQVGSQHDSEADGMVRLMGLDSILR